MRLFHLATSVDSTWNSVVSSRHRRDRCIPPCNLWSSSTPPGKKESFCKCVWSCMDLCLDSFGNHVWICVRIFFGNHLWICVGMFFGNHMCICKKDYFGNHGSVFSSPPGSCRAGWVCWQWQLFQPKRRGRFNFSISSSPSYIAVKVDVDDAVALAIGALVVELCNLVDCPTQLIVSWQIYQIRKMRKYSR